MRRTTKVLLDGLDFPEGPRWHDGKLWFSDMDRGLVMTVDLNGKADIIVKAGAETSGLGWLSDGTLLVVLMADRRLLRLKAGELLEVADLSGLASFMANDMVVDAYGSAYIGHFGFAFMDLTIAPRPAEIILVTPAGDARIVADEMAFPNGMVITPDGRTLIVAESLAARLTAFDIASDGSLARRRVWAEFDDLGFRPYDPTRVFPDGICLDAAGAIWMASPGGGGEVLRVLEGGEVTDRVAVERQPFAAMLGGPDRRTLFVCTSRMGESFTSGIGRIETVHVETPGAGLP